MTIETLSIDIAKNVFELHGVNHSGRVLLKGRVMRDQLLAVRRIPIDARLSSKPAREHSMDAQVRSARTSGEAYQPAILEAVCVSAKNDGQRRRSDLHGLASTTYSLLFRRRPCNGESRP